MKLALLGGVVGLDAVSCPQVMISRPLIAGALAGVLLGDPVEGMWIGMFLELLTLRQLPIGAARQWDAGLGAIVGAVTYIASPAGREEGIILGVAVGTAVAWLGGWSIHSLRQLNARLVAGLADRPTSPARLAWRHLLAMGIDYVRGTLLTLLAAVIVVWALGALGPVPELDESLAALILVSAATLALGGLVRTLVSGPRAWIAFGTGVLGSLGVWLWLG